MISRVRKIFILSLLILVSVLTVQDTSFVKAAGQTTGDYFQTDEFHFIKDGYFPETEEVLRAQSTQTDNFACKQAIFNTLSKLDTGLEISQYQLTPTEFKSVMQSVIDANPQFFYLNKQYKYSVTGSYVNKVSLAYLYGKDVIEMMQSQIASAVGDILEGMNPQMTELEKALYVHDKLAARTHYNTNVTVTSLNSNSFNMYGVLVERTGVCQGYASAYMYILKTYLNMSCEMITSEKMVHAWNLVRIGGIYYHVDVTGDDPVPDCIGYVNHAYFLCSDSYMTSNQYYDYVTPFSANDTHYDGAFWKAYVSPFIFIGEYGWFTINSGKIMNVYAATAINNYTDMLVRKEFQATGGLNQGYGYSMLANNGDLLYYNTGKYVCSMKIDGTEHKRLYEYTGAEQIIGIAFTNGILQAEVRYSLMVDGTIISIPEITKAEKRTNYYVTFQTGSEQITSFSLAVPGGGLVNVPTNPTKTGYMFNGWYTGLNGTKELWNPAIPITNDLVVYASWIEGDGPATAIRIDTPVKVTVGKKQSVGVTFTPANPFNKKLIYQSSNSKVATVSTSGVVKGIKVGKCTITVTVADNSALQTKVSVKVLPKNVTKFKVKAGKRLATVTWKSAKKTSGVVLYRSTSKKGRYKKIATIKGTSKKKYINKGLLKKGIYFYKIVTYQKVKGKKYYSMDSKIIKIKAKA